MEIDVEQFRGPCSCKRPHDITVKGIWIESGAARKLYEMLTEGELRDFTAPAIVWDENTKEAAMDAMEDVEEICESVCLDCDNLHADNHGVEILEETLPEETDLILAVGSGTIHDLSRYVSHKWGIPFVSVPTAASVDGFVSTVAAMTWNGMKKTVPAQAPLYVFADTDIFSKAPYRLTASGMSDLMGKYIALTDWKIAALVTGEYICERTVKLEEQALEKTINLMDELREGEPEAYEQLMYALLLSGIAMQMVGNSRPASCAEHHVSHLWEMQVINGPLDALHGEKVSVGLVLVRKRYEQIAEAIEKGTCRLRPYHGLEMELLEETFGTRGLLDLTVKENTPDPLELVEPEKLWELLPEIAKILSEIPSSEEMKQLLEKAGCCSEPEHVGIDRGLVPMTLELCPYVRNRLSFLRMSKMLEING